MDTTESRTPRNVPTPSPIGTDMRRSTSRRSLAATLLPALPLLPALATPTHSQCAVVADLVPGPTGSFPQGFATAFGQQVYFTCQSALFGAELWKWDAASGAVLVKDIRSGPTGSSLSGLTPCCTALGPRVFFSAFFPGAGAELWNTDGTTAGTTLLKDIRPGNSSSSPGRFAASDGRMFFAANDGIHGIELWVSDGTTAGTQMLKDIDPGPTGAQPANPVVLDGLVCFTAFLPATGREVWVTDGTEPGTQLLADIGPGTASAPAAELIRCGDAVFFAADDGVAGNELWKTDGTPAGTGMVADLALGPSASSPGEFCCCQDLLFFSATGGAFSRELYVSDGTAAGTRLVKDINPAGGGSSGPNNITCAGNRVFFQANAGGGNGVELWVSDGTAAGTYEVEIYPGALSSYPQLFVAAGTGACFRATDTRGAEVWFTDGTAPGTFQVCDLDPSGSGNPTQFFGCAGRVFFTAPDPTFGNELFSLVTPGAMAEVLGEGGRPSRPTLVAAQGATPVLGTTFGLVAAGPAAHTGFLFVGPSALPSPPLPGLMQGGCDWAGLLTGFAVGIVATPLPSLTLPVAVPNQTSLEGAALNFQMVWLGAASPPLQLSNGLQVVVGTAAAH